MLVIVMCASAMPALAQDAEVDQTAILRLGNLVQHVGDGARADGEVDAFAEAMAPPASDADKWFISVLTTRGCSGCELLKQQWAKDPWLLALANPNDPKQSWAHYNVYDASDKSQEFRFDNVKASVYPTILVQPPRTGRYGDPSTIVFQGVYENDPEKLARGITTAIRKYVAKCQETPVAPLAPASGGYGADPPWAPTPRVDPWQPTPQVSPFDPTIPPQPAPQPTPSPTPAITSPWVTLIWPLVAPAVVAGVAWLAYSIRAKRLADGKQPIVDQATLEQILALLKKVAETPPQTPKA
jgi:hypothetical protein